jgi:hypothetical protein
VIALPPLAGATQLTVSFWLLAKFCTVGAAGALGTVVTATVVVAEDADVPAALVAVTLMVYVIAEVKLPTTTGELAPDAVLVV